MLLSQGDKPGFVIDGRLHAGTLISRCSQGQVVRSCKNPPLIDGGVLTLPLSCLPGSHVPTSGVGRMSSELSPPRCYPCLA